MNTRSLFVGLWGSHTLSLCDCGGNCSSMRSQFYHRPHVFFKEFGNLPYSQFPLTKITLFLHMSICAEPDQCSKKYFPDHFFPGPSSECGKSICLGQIRTQLQISICPNRLSPRSSFSKRVYALGTTQHPALRR
jgi:hypothetical protein